MDEKQTGKCHEEFNKIAFIIIVFHNFLLQKKEFQFQKYVFFFLLFLDKFSIHLKINVFVKRPKIHCFFYFFLRRLQIKHEKIFKLYKLLNQAEPKFFILKKKKTGKNICIANEKKLLLTKWRAKILFCSNLKFNIFVT